MSIIEKFCNKVLWLEHGVVREVGSPAAVLAAYKSAYQRAGTQRG